MIMILADDKYILIDDRSITIIWLTIMIQHSNFLSNFYCSLVCNWQNYTYVIWRGYLSVLFCLMKLYASTMNFIWYNKNEYVAFTRPDIFCSGFRINRRHRSGVWDRQAVMFTYVAKTIFWDVINLLHTRWEFLTGSNLNGPNMKVDGSVRLRQVYYWLYLVILGLTTRGKNIFWT